MRSDFSEYLHLDEETGKLHWKVVPSPSKLRVGDEVGCLNTEGYRVFKLKGKQYRTHKVIWFMLYGETPKILDHKNRNRADNRPCNLREVNDQESALNRGTPKHNTSGVTGVSYHKPSGKWRASISDKGKRIYKEFGSKQEAINWRLMMEVELGYGVPKQPPL